MPTHWMIGEGRCTWESKTEMSHVIFRGSRVGMLRKTSSQVLEARCGGVEEHKPACIRKRKRAGLHRESEGFILPFEGKGQHNPA